MTVAMFYGGYGYGGSWIIFLLLAFFVIRMVTARRSGSNQAQRGPGPQGWGWGSPPPGRPPQPTASSRPTSAPPSSATSTAPGGPPGGPPTAAPAPPSGYKIAPGWFPDPTGRFDQRYWSGTTWTEHVTKDGAPGTDVPPAGLSGSG